MAPTLPTPPATSDDFRKRYARDFPFGDGNDTVTEQDIQNAMSDAMPVFNPGLFSVADGWVAFLHLTAHYVATNVQAAGGLTTGDGDGTNNQADGIIASKGVSGANASYVEPPDKIKQNPTLFQIWQTGYGRKYCQMVAPKLVGAVAAVSGPDDCGGGFVPPSIPFANP